MCHDINNNEECGYDLGDCCKPVVECPEKNNIGLNCSVCHETKVVHITYEGTYINKQVEKF